jgi:hypothetical protein
MAAQCSLLPTMLALYLLMSPEIISQYPQTFFIASLIQSTRSATKPQR